MFTKKANDWREAVLKANRELLHDDMGHACLKVIAEAPVDDLPKKEIDGMLALWNYYETGKVDVTSDDVIQYISSEYTDMGQSLVHTFICGLCSRFNNFVEEEEDFINARRIAFEAYALNAAIFGEAHDETRGWLDNLAIVSRALDCPLNAEWFEAKSLALKTASKDGDKCR